MSPDDALDGTVAEAASLVRSRQLSPVALTEASLARLETTGVHVVVMPGELTTAIGAIGDPAGVAELGLEVMPGVDRLVPISRPFKLAGRELGEREHSVFAVDGHEVGPDTFTLIAGPCTVESREQTLAVARAVKEGGASMMRAGVCVSPRSANV